MMLFLILLLLFTFPFFLFFAIFFGSIVMVILTTLLTILLIYKSEDRNTIKPGILFLFFGGLFYFFISLNHGLVESFSSVYNIGLYMTLAEFASVAGFISFVFFIKETFYLILNFFTIVFEKINILFKRNKEDKIIPPKFTNEELNNYYLYNSEYIKWLHLYTNNKSFIKTKLDNNLDFYRINKNEYNLRNLSRFFTSLINYYEKNNIKIYDNPTSKYVVISYQNKLFEIGLHKLDKGYVYCKVIIYRNPAILITPFESILNSKNKKT